MKLIEDYLKMIRRKLFTLNEGHNILAQVARKSVSVLNMTRVNLVKNRQNNNLLIWDGDFGMWEVLVMQIGEPGGVEKQYLDKKQTRLVYKFNMFHF